MKNFSSLRPVHQSFKNIFLESKIAGGFCLLDLSCRRVCCVCS